MAGMRATNTTTRHPAGDSLLTPKLISVKVFRHKLVQTLEIEHALKVPAQLAPDRKSRSQKLVTIPIRSRVSLIPGGERMEIHTEIENTAKDHRLRVHFPAPFSVQNADYDGHFEVVRRPIGVPEKKEKWVEEPRPETHQRAFTDVSDGKIGIDDRQSRLARSGSDKTKAITPKSR